MTTTTPTTHTVLPLAAACLPATPRVVARAAFERAADEGKVPADVAAASLRAHRIARLPIAASPSLVRWTLRMVTVIVFGAATAFGASLGMNAPEISPTSVVQHPVASSDQ
jgi:hypothetical protein